MTAEASMIAIRADGSPTVGGGHIARCVALARALRDSHGAPRLFVNPEAGPIISSLDARGLEVEFVGPGIAAFSEAIMGLAAEKTVDVVLDHYGWSRDEERQLRGLARQIVIIDDLANRPHDCDILIDQNYGRNFEDYVGLVPRFARCLIGPDFAILRPEFLAAREATLRRRETVTKPERILVSLGLTDVGGITLRTVEAIRAAGIHNPIDVVVSPTSQSIEKLRALNDPTLTLHVAPRNMASLMAEADLAIGAAGTTTWERCCLGLPTAVLVLADNQLDAAKHLQEAGIANAFEADETGISNAATSLSLLLSDPARRRAMTDASISLVDGRGAERCAQAILNPTVRLRPVGPDDEQPLRSWRNEALVRAVSRTTHEITAAQHHAWFSTLLQDEDRILLIAEIDGEAVGMVRLDPDGAREIGAHKISIILGPAVRGRGLAKQIIERAIWQTRATRAGGPLYAEIMKDNARSEAVFGALGFALQHPADAEGFCLYRRTTFNHPTAPHDARRANADAVSPIIALRRMTQGDAEQVREWRTRPEISRHMYTEPSITPDQQVEWVSNSIADETRHYWIIELDGVPVGLANMVQIDQAHMRGSWAFYLADPATRGKGVGTAVEFAIIEYAFGSLALNKLCCEVLSTNTAVLDLHQKFGFSREGVLRQHILKGDTFCDIIIFGMLASDWITHRPRHLERFRELGIVPPVAR